MAFLKSFRKFQLKNCFPVLLAVIIATGRPLAGAPADPGLKVYVSVDMEGIWGVVHTSQTSDGSPDYGPARKWMAEDVNAVIAGLFDAGATEVVINDAHGSQRNILASDLDSRAGLISGSPKPLVMMEGIDSSFQACVFVGYHAMAGTEAAILDHTISSRVALAIRINGREMPELGINAGIAGYFGVPVVLISGDTATCLQAKRILGEGIVALPVKEAVGRNAAKMVPRAKALEALRERAKQALLKRESINPFKFDSPVRFDLVCASSGQAETGPLIPGVSLTDARTLSFTEADIIKGFKLLRALISLAASR